MAATRSTFLPRAARAALGINLGGKLPRAMRYQTLVAEGEEIMALALPQVVRRLVDLCGSTDQLVAVQAVKYLTDRILGAPPRATVIPAEDMSAPVVLKTQSAIALMLKTTLKDLDQQTLERIQAIVVADLRAKGKIAPDTSQAEPHASGGTDTHLEIVGDNGNGRPATP